MTSLFLLIVSTLISFCTIPFVKKLAYKVGAIDIPKDERKIHKNPTPRLGGLSIFISFVITTLLFTGEIEKFEISFVVGATIIVIGGVIDDIYEIRPIAKLIFQILAASVLVSTGVHIDVLSNPFSNINPMINISLLAIPITIIWIVGVTNAFNLIDGLDGLAGGVALISSATIFIIAINSGRGSVAALTIILCGAIAGFLPYNFNPASIFMGDTGAQLLGFLLASISVEGTVKSATAFAVAVPLLTIGLPLYDTLFAMIRRKINGQPISQADRGHLHHRLLDIGLSQKKAVIVMYIISFVLGIIAIYAMELSATDAYMLLIIVLIVIVIIAYKCGFFKTKDT